MDKEEEFKLNPDNALDWSLGNYDNKEFGCPNCGRFRLCICPNGKHRCEKCNWSPELNNYVLLSQS